MTFLNQILALGALAFLIPLLIHIFNRSRFRQVEWGAMHLLESVIKVNHKRFRIEQLILLMVRCAIPILLALCLARPVLTGWKTLEGNAPVSMVVLLDNSYSMDTTDSNTSSGDRETRFDEAVESACKIIEATGRGSEIAVIQTGGSPASIFDQPVFDSKTVVQRLRQQTGGYGQTDTQRSLDAALATLSKMTNPRRELIVISDFQPADWDSIGADTASAIQTQMKAINIEPSLTLLPIGNQNSARSGGNVSVDSLDFSSRALGIGQRLMLRANIRCDGEPGEGKTKARVVLRIDGNEFSTAEVTIADQGTTQALFPCKFETAGSHVIEVEVVHDDPLPTDNRFAAAITVWDQIPVTLVDGDPSSKPLKSETDFLSIALTPYTFGRLTLSDLLQTKKIAPHELNENTISESRVVVLANVPRLNDKQLEQVSEFVKEGGALFVFAGNRMDVNWYNEKMFAAGSGILPARLDSVKGTTGRANEKTTLSRIVAQFFDHPALQFFNEAANGDLSTASISQWYELSAAEPAHTIARLETGDPFLVELNYENGVVVQCATACDNDWSDLPLRPFFVPLMQQLVTTAASQLSPPRNIQTGEPASALIHDQPDRSQVSIKTPDGTKKTIQTTKRGPDRLAQFDGTQKPGIYTMSLPESETIHFVATTSRDESDLRIYDQQQLTDTAQQLGATLVEDSTEYLKQDRLRRHGREIWKYVLAGLLVLMFCELVLQQRFARVPA